MNFSNGIFLLIKFLEMIMLKKKIAKQDESFVLIFGWFVNVAASYFKLKLHWKYEGEKQPIDLFYYLSVECISKSSQV